MPLQIRPAASGDVPVILGFIRGLATYEKLLHEVEATEDKLAAGLFPSGGRHPAAECILAFLDDHPAGFALFFGTYSTFLAKPGLYLEDIYVEPGFRGRGIGRALLLHVARLACARDCGRLEWSVLNWNQPAIRFYDSIGARMLPDWRICRLTGESLSRHA
jgi:GNAT superfamily N-acetyltransferase